MMAEARKFGIELVLANQSFQQVNGTRGLAEVASAILANAANILAFRVGPVDARELVPWFSPEIDAKALSRLPDRCFAARPLVDGTVSCPMMLTCTPPKASGAEAC